MAWLSDYYLMAHTGRHSREDIQQSRKCTAFEEEIAMEGRFWTKSRKIINGIWGTCYLCGPTLPKELQEFIHRYDNIAVYQYTSPTGRCTKGKAVFIGDRCFDIKKRKGSKKFKTGQGTAGVRRETRVQHF